MARQISEEEAREILIDEIKIIREKLGKHSVGYYIAYLRGMELHRLSKERDSLRAELDEKLTGNSRKRGRK